MPINPTTLKALIDTQITNETVDFAITPAEVGGRMKDTIDYTTEQIASVTSTPDATDSIKGKIKLAGDLGGTADLPTVPALANKQDTLVSNTNIKTVNGSTLLGSGNLVISAAFPYLESSFKVNQSGTSNPTDTNYFIDQVRISPTDNTNPLYRDFTFNRVAVGQYNFQILWLTGSSSAINVTKLDMSIGNGNIKLTSSSNGSFGPYSYFQQDINVYSASGALSDDLFYTNFYVRLFL